MRFRVLAIWTLLLPCFACNQPGPAVGEQGAESRPNNIGDSGVATAQPIPRAAVTSSAMKSVGYGEDREVLAIEFPNRSVYEYQDVPRSVYQELIAAESKGRYFQQHIRNVYKFVRK
jgi:hypothetical protein